MKSAWKLGWVILAALLIASPLQSAETTTVPAAASAPTATSQAAKEGIAVIRMAGEVQESPPQFSLFEDPATAMTLRDWLQRLAKARNDKSIKAVLLEVDGLALSWAQAQELSDAVHRLAEVKPVYACVVEVGTSQYLVASGATQVVMDGAGSLMMMGIGIEMMYFKGTMDLLGIKPQMIQIGKFKGAAEPIAQSRPSQEVVTMYNWLLDDLFDQLCSHIATARKIKKEDAKDALDAGPFSGGDAVKYHLVDKLVSKIEWRSHVLAELKTDETKTRFIEGYGKKDRQSLDFSNPFAMLGMLLNGPKKEQPVDPTIALICADGMIVSGRGGEGLLGGKMMGSRTIVEAFEEVRKDSHVKAVVLRIDSPGGSAIASEEMYQAIRKCAAAKPVIVSIGAMGASGGFYIALGGTEIIADPAGIVGSIGVVSGKLALGGLFDKIGVTTYEITRGRNAGLMLGHEWDVREENVMRRLVVQIYDLFISRVKESRKDKIKDVDEVAQGRVFTAQQAAKNGLIDKVGSLKDAIEDARVAAKLPESFHMIVLPRPRTLMDLLSGSDDDADAIAPFGESTALQAMLLKKVCRGNTSAGLPYLLNVAAHLGRENALLVMPYYLSIRQ